MTKARSLSDFIESDGSVTLVDNQKIKVGTGNDLEIYHDGSNSFIADVGTGVLDIQTNGTEIQMTKGGSELMAKLVPDGAVTLYYDNAAKLATTSTGVDVTGVITTDGLTTSADINFGDDDKAIFGAGSDLQIYHDGSNSYVSDQGTGQLVLLTNSFRLNNAANSENIITAEENGAVSLFYNDAVKLATTSTGVDVTGGITSSGGLTAFSNFVIAQDSGGIYLGKDDNSTLRLITNNTTRMTIRNDGGIGIGNNNAGYSSQVLSVKSAGEDTVFYGESTDANCIVSLRDNSSTANIGYGALANAHVFSQDGTEIARFSTGSADKYPTSGNGGIGGAGSNLHLHGDDSEIRMANQIIHADNSGLTKFTIRNAYGHHSAGAELSLDGGHITFNAGTSFTQVGRFDTDGLKFNADTAAANGLDDYEEGAFTPSIANTGLSPTPTGVGYYCKIGSVVYVSMYFSGISPTNAGNTRINGLPYSASVPGNAYSICYYSHGTILANNVGGGGGYFTGTSIDVIGPSSTGYNAWAVGSNKYGMWSGFYFSL